MKLGFFARFFRRTFHALFSSLVQRQAAKYKQRVGTHPQWTDEQKAAVRQAVDEVVASVLAELEAKLA